MSCVRANENRCQIGEGRYGMLILLAAASTSMRSSVKHSSYRFQQFSSGPSSLRLYGSDRNSQNPSCFADRKMIYIPQVKCSPQNRGQPCCEFAQPRIHPGLMALLLGIGTAVDQDIG